LFLFFPSSLVAFACVCSSCNQLTHLLVLCPSPSGDFLFFAPSFLPQLSLLAHRPRSGFLISLAVSLAISLFNIVLDPSPSIHTVTVSIIDTIFALAICPQSRACYFQFITTHLDTHLLSFCVLLITFVCRLIHAIMFLSAIDVYCYRWLQK
jgi:hypothetical protein